MELMNDTKTQELFENLKNEGAGTAHIAVDETLEGYFYGISKNDYTVGVIVMYTNKQIIFVVLSPMGQPEHIVVAHPHDIRNIQIKKGWMFFHFSFEFVIGDDYMLELKANKKVFGFKKQISNRIF